MEGRAGRRGHRPSNNDASSGTWVPSSREACACHGRPAVRFRKLTESYLREISYSILSRGLSVSAAPVHGARPAGGAVPRGDTTISTSHGRARTFAVVRCRRGADPTPAEFSFVDHMYRGNCFHCLQRARSARICACRPRKCGPSETQAELNRCDVTAAPATRHLCAYSAGCGVFFASSAARASASAL